MDIKIYPSKLNGSVFAVSSKSLSHRYIIACALTNTPSKVFIFNRSNDIVATVNCLKKLGANIDYQNGFYSITPIDFNNVPKGCELDAEGSASTLRFLIPVASALTDNVGFTGNASLTKRPVNDLLYALKGVGFSREKLPLNIVGNLKAGDYRIKGDISSQYISGLLFALPLLSGDSTITIIGELCSKPYVEMTLKVLSEFGIKIEQTENGFKVFGNQTYTLPKEINIEGDYSNSAFFITANKLGGKIEINNLPSDTKQGDSKIYSFLEAIDNGQDIDAKNNPDLVPILAVYACFKDKKIKIYNAKRLKLKESDRLNAIKVNLNKLGGKVDETDDGLIIEGTKKLNGNAVVDSFSDHRIAMAMAIAGIYSENPITILSGDCVSKSYPDFWNDLIKVGAKVDAL